MRSKKFLSALLITTLYTLLILYPLTGKAIETNFPQLNEDTATLLERKNERIMGDTIMQKIHGSDFYVADPVVNEYLRNIAQYFKSQPNLSETPLDIFGVNTPDFNAFAFFGGHIAVHSGLIEGVQNESELVAVLAHETAHISQRHLARMVAASKALMPLTLAELFAGIAIGALGAPDAGAHIATAAIAGHTQQMINFTKEHEKEADRVGIQMLAQTPFNPTAMATVFERMKKNSQFQSRPPEYLLTHPVFDARIADAQHRAALFKPHTHTGQPHQSSLDFYLIRARLNVTQEESSHKKINRLETVLSTQKYDNKTAANYAYALALLESPHQKQKGFSLLETLVQENPEQWILKLSLADAQMKNGQSQQALQSLESLMSIYPQNYAVTLAYAEALLKSKNPTKAISILTKKRKKHLQDPVIHQILARAYSMSRQPIELHRSQAEYHFTRGESKEAIQQMNLALEYAEKEHSILFEKIQQRKTDMETILIEQKEIQL